MAVLTDLGNIPEVTVDIMLDHIVSNLGINVESILGGREFNSMLVGRYSLIVAHWQALRRQETEVFFENGNYLPGNHKFNCV